MSAIRRIYKNARKPFAALWRWAKKGDHPRRWQRLVRWTTKKREQARRGHKLARARFWAAKRTVYRKKWRKAKKRLDPKWEDWMANGRSLNFNAAAKKEAAIAVVTFDCAVTSTYRATVIPQSNPNSYHGPNVSPGKAVDVAGARMGVYQQDCFSRRKGDGSLLELYGPINHLGLKNGAQVTLGEGTFLEDLHDSHVHVAAD